MSGSGIIMSRQAGGIGHHEHLEHHEKAHHITLEVEVEVEVGREMESAIPDLPWQVLLSARSPSRTCSVLATHSGDGSGI